MTLAILLVACLLLAIGLTRLAVSARDSIGILLIVVAAFLHLWTLGTVKGFLVWAAIASLIGLGVTVSQGMRARQKI